VAEGLDFFKQGLTGATGGRLSHQATCIREKDFGWIALSELNPEMLGLLWLKTSVA
jgi:hypothetical protein